MKWLCKLLPHWWEDTHRNRWQIATRQKCSRCGAVRKWRGGPGGQWESE